MCIHHNPVPVQQLSQFTTRRITHTLFSTLLAGLGLIGACADTGSDPGNNAAGLGAGQSQPHADTSRTPKQPVASRPATPGLLVLVGGGGAGDDVYGRFVAAAGYGHIVTLGAVQDPENYPDLLFWDQYFTELGASSAQTINTETAAEAADPALFDLLQQADGIFIRGGSQKRYVEYWLDSPVQAGLVAAWQQGAVLGGTSAGAMVLGRPIYDAREGGVSAYDALADPFDPAITFTDEIVPTIANLIIDTHFTSRGRLGRLPVFLARAPFAAQPAPLGLGLDSRTAVFLSPDGTFEVVGPGSVTLLDPSWGQSIVSPGQPPQITSTGFWQLPAGYRVDLAALRRGEDPVIERPSYVVPGPAEIDSVGPLPSLYLDGNNVGQRALGTWQIEYLNDDIDAWRDRLLTLTPGEDRLPGLLVMTGLYDDSDFYENYFGGLMWAVAQHPEIVGVGVDIYHFASTRAPHAVAAAPSTYAFVVDAREAAYVGADPQAAWMTAAIEGARIRVVNGDSTWDGAAGDWLP